MNQDFPNFFLVSSCALEQGWEKCSLPEGSAFAPSPSTLCFCDIQSYPTHLTNYGSKALFCPLGGLGDTCTKIFYLSLLLPQVSPQESIFSLNHKRETGSLFNLKKSFQYFRVGKVRKRVWLSKVLKRWACAVLILLEVAHSSIGGWKWGSYPAGHVVGTLKQISL